jgi:predicted outer membrane protein
MRGLLSSSAVAAASFFACAYAQDRTAATQRALTDPVQEW